ncbi:MAG: hypothetical protein H0V92_00160 [Pseudonocardiales bacterium]|nr:hypothetical protein [Pseudonocardiales bacterium]
MRDIPSMLDEPFRGSEAVALGLLTPGQLRGARYRRLFPDVYVRAEAANDLALMSRAAYALSRGTGVLGGYSAAEFWRTGCAPSGVPAEVIVPEGEMRTCPGLVVHRDVLASDEIRTVSGVPVTTALRTAYDLARWRPLVDAVVVLDALAGRAGFAPPEVLDLARRYPRAKGRRGLPRVVELADPHADSPMETRLRLLLVLGGLPAPVSQHPVTPNPLGSPVTGDDTQGCSTWAGGFTGSPPPTSYTVPTAPWRWFAAQPHHRVRHSA